jgi:DNA invertase Pin-like site-specific DNA recombinase
MNPKLTADHLRRRAVIYVRQSSMGQVLHNHESQLRQYGLADRARGLGFRDVMVIDDDLGRSGSGLVERPGFQRLVAEVCTGEVGAIFCIEASRLARNGRDWHHLIELCGMVGSVVVDPDGVYDPGVINDRLLLGLKGTMSEFELNLLRQRSLEAIRQKARRGELRFLLPVGLCWGATGKVEKTPDRRVQDAIQMVFTKMTQLGSIRQVLLWFRQEKICLPALPRDPGEPKMVWKAPVYNTLWHMLTNPTYAGAYAFGKTQARTKMVDGRARKTVGHRKPRPEWTVLIREHHPGYISWEQFERNQQLIAANAHMKSRMEPKAGRGGRALLSGILRCRRCGRMLHVSYTGLRHAVLRYHCKGAHLNHGADWCISFGGLKTDEAVANAVLRAIGGNAVEAALEAAEQMRQSQQQQRKTLELEVEHATYEAHLASRRYEAVDPQNRLVAGELESRWNACLQRARELQARLERFDRDIDRSPLPDQEMLVSLAQDLPSIWNSPTTDMRLKQRIIRILIHEIVADVDAASNEIVLLLHWTGGRHSELRIKKNALGKHRRCTSVEAIAAIREMAGRFSDQQIAATLNRLGLRTGAQHSWTETRVRSARQYHGFPTCDPTRVSDQMLTMEEAAERLGVSARTVRRMIEEKQLPATQAVPCAPWQIRVDELETERISKVVQNIKSRAHIPRARIVESQESMFS